MGEKLKFKIAALIVCGSALVGCGESFSDKPKPDFSQKSFKLVEIEVVQGKKAGEYGVLFKPLVQRPFSIVKHDYLNGTSEEIATGISREYLDENVVTGYLYKYEVGEYALDKKFMGIDIKEVKIPLDIVLRSNETQSIDTKEATLSTEGFLVLAINRIYLEQNSVLYTNANNLHLKISELKSNYGNIETLPTSQSADIGVDGRRGGELIVHIENAEGDLKITLRGENGGEGRRPEGLGEKGKGPKGKKGTVNGKANVYYDSSPGSNGGQEEECISSPGKGSPGGKGQKGLKANSGRPGGDSGSAIVYVANSHDFNLGFKFEPGIGGKPSLGGEGGFGGDGGDSAGEEVLYIDTFENSEKKSFNSTPQICNINNGPKGSQGDIGETSVSGENGKNGKICFKENQDSEIKCFTENVG